jgi:RNA recognition motif-containing protein
LSLFKNVSHNVAAWTELKDHMRAEGKFNVAYAEVICEKNGRSKGCGIVEYSTEEEAHQAIEELTHTELKGRMIFVREDREIPSNPSVTNKAGEHTKGSKDHHNNQNTSVYIWNLDYSTTWFQLKE